MKGATLHQRLACGAAPRRCWPASARPGTRVCVIVPSKDNASGSGGKRVPLLWTFSDSGSPPLLKHQHQHHHQHQQQQQHVEQLEEVFSRGAAEEPHLQEGAEGGEAGGTATCAATAAAAPSLPSASSPTSTLALPGEHRPQQHQHQQQEEDVLVAALEVKAEAEWLEGRVEAEGWDAAALRERIESAALASTSTSTSPPAALPVTVGAAAGLSGSGGSRGHHRSAAHHHHNQQQLPPAHAAAAASPHSNSNGTPSAPGSSPPHMILPSSHHPMNLSPNHNQQQQHHRLSQSLPGSGSATPHSASQPPQQPQHESPGSSAPPPAPTPGSEAPAAAAPGPAAAPAPADSSIPGSIWILCCISAALTCASCVFNTALPIYMVSELKMSMRSMGMFEGLLEAFSYIVRMCSGVVSDRMTSRKAAITLGFAAGAAAKFGMASAGSVGLLFAGKAVDRLANGIQAAPRDALIGDLSPAGVRSACFGLAQSLRKWGSAVGALAAFFLMKASNNNYQLIFYSAATVSLVACLAFVVFVPAHPREQPQQGQGQAVGAAAPAAVAAGSGAPSASASSEKGGLSGVVSGLQEFVRGVVSLGSDFYRMLGVISLYALGHINESLLEARAMEVGFGKAEATLVVAAIAAVTFLTAYPLGRLDDKYGPGTTFAVGIGALIAGDLVLLLSGPHPLALFASCLFLGVHWAVIQGPLLSIVSGLAPGHMRGTAFGIFYTVMAVTAVAANTMYGSIWHTYGANAAFMTSAVLMSAVLGALPYMLPASARRGGAIPASAPGSGPAAPAAGAAAAGGPSPSSSPLLPSPLPAAA
ncbi:hypothetical protein PLESTB_001406700 [Pleodorina starrii]|uniref:Major facilitator superfamily (MFS) profile domain-containing protein n=1 Tax=Pleodorina starrii TaxID=330485 RepID=A0A9W6BV86_9CHLO|nr:hypothetical protein PLESTB_001406700 [Pleodorina starrii]GLC68022.1 hypothetical protein PLESTF_000636600 [Pleodorina starrii]